MPAARPPSVAVSADSPATADAARRTWEEGGNVVDMAIAAALAATVSEVLMCSLGGSAFLMILPAGGEPELVDGSDAMPRIDRPPAKGSRAWSRVQLPYGDGIEVVSGHASVAVPGMLSALETAWRRHGSLPWKELVAPALEIAAAPCPTGTTLGRWLEIAGKLVFFPQEASRACFFPDGETPLRQGQPFRIPHMAETLELIAAEGARALYEGDLAAAFAREMEAEGGFVTRDDLAAYHAEVRNPLPLASDGFELLLNPPPAVGGAAVGSLIGLVEAGWGAVDSDAERALLHARAQEVLLGLRDGDLHDPALDADQARALLAPATLRRHLHALRSPNTTHLSIAGGDGSMAAITMSNGYGSGITIPGTGVICNNSLGEPELNPQGYHAAAPGTRMVSNMAPTLARHPDGRILAMGSPGASRITTAIAQTWIHYALEDRSFAEAVAAPRLHLEPTGGRLRAQCEAGVDTCLLEDAGYAVRPFEQRDMYFGAVKLAGRDKGGRLHAIADDRREGATWVA